MSGGGGSTTQTVTKADPWSGVQPQLRSLYPQVEGALNNRLPFYPNQTYADFNPLQEQGMFDSLGYAQNQYQPAMLGYQDTLQNYMNAPLDITNDPAVQNMFQPPAVGRSFFERRDTSVCQSIACRSTLKPAWRISCPATSGSLSIEIRSVGFISTTGVPS